MFPKVNALPGAQREPPMDYRYAKREGGKRGANMRGHVIRPLGCMHKRPIAVGRQPAKKCLQIAPHVRIGIFLD